MQGAFKNCPRCRKAVYMMPFSKICDQCVKEEEEIYKSVSDLLKESPGLSLAELSSKSGVSTKKILAYVREGRIQILERILSCKICDERIEKGTLCASCEQVQKKALLQTIKSAVKDKPIESNNRARMHTEQRRNSK